MYSWPFNKGYETDGINNNNFIHHYIYLAIIIIINFAEYFNRSFLELRLDLKSPELELELKSLELELELELKLIVSSGIGIGIENNGIGIGIELKKWNWPQPWQHQNIFWINGVLQYSPRPPSQEVIKIPIHKLSLKKYTCKIMKLLKHLP